MCGLNSFCKSPNVCECNMGYTRESNDSSQCIVALWIYLAIGLLALIILLTIGMIIYCFFRPKTFNFYPNTNKDTTPIVMS